MKWVQSYFCVHVKTLAAAEQAQAVTLMFILTWKFNLSVGLPVSFWVKESRSSQKESWVVALVRSNSAAFVKWNLSVFTVQEATKGRIYKADDHFLVR